MSQQTAPPKPLPSAAAKLFDLRILIGGLFSLYGVVLIIAGIFDGPEAREDTRKLVAAA